MINDLINVVIDDLFVGGGDYYYYVLNEKNRVWVMSLKENVVFLVLLFVFVNIFNYMVELVMWVGK